MTDPIPDEAVEAAVAGISDRLKWASMHWGTERVHPDAWPHIARAALTAAALHIAAQATANDPRKIAHIECDCVPDLGPSHCHLCGEREGREMPWTEAHPLRTRIAALRGLIEQWRDRTVTVMPSTLTAADTERLTWGAAADELERALGVGA